MNIQKYRPIDGGRLFARRPVSSRGRWEDWIVSQKAKQIGGKQSARSARRHEERRGEAGRSDGEIGGTKNGTTAIEAIVPCHMWWTKRGSNPRPPACKAVALATELLARIDIYNIPAWRRERNRKIQPPSYLRNSSDWAKQAGDYPLPVPLAVVTSRPS